MPSARRVPGLPSFPKEEGPQMRAVVAHSRMSVSTPISRAFGPRRSAVREFDARHAPRGRGVEPPWRCEALLWGPLSPLGLGSRRARLSLARSGPQGLDALCLRYRRQGDGDVSRPFFDLVLVWNQGVSYGMLQQQHSDAGPHGG